MIAGTCNFFIITERDLNIQIMINASRRATGRIKSQSCFSWKIAGCTNISNQLKNSDARKEVIPSIMTFEVMPPKVGLTTP